MLVRGSYGVPAPGLTGGACRRARPTTRRTAGRPCARRARRRTRHARRGPRAAPRGPRPVLGSGHRSRSGAAPGGVVGALARWSRGRLVEPPVVGAAPVGHDRRERRNHHGHHAHADRHRNRPQPDHGPCRHEERQARTHHEEVATSPPGVHASSVRLDLGPAPGVWPGRCGDTSPPRTGPAHRAARPRAGSAMPRRRRRGAPKSHIARTPCRCAHARRAAPHYKASNPLGAALRSRWRVTRQTVMATSARPPCWATTVRSAVAPGTRARSVQVPSAA